MTTIEGFPYAAVQFTKDGAVHSRAEVDALLQMTGAADLTDLIVLAHGWNNTMAQAENLYTHLLRLMRGELTAGRVAGLGGRRFAAFGILWPSKQFAPSELTASGAAAMESVVTDEVLDRQLTELAELIDDSDATAEIEKARELIPQLDDRRSARQEYADLLRSAVTASAPEASEASDEDASTDLFTLTGDVVMDRLAKPVLPAPGPGGGGAASLGGSAAGLGGIFSGGPRGAARNLGNFLTYYKMKERAGTVGAGGAYQVLAEVRQSRPNLRLHLVGHSFGARLVTAAAAGRPPLRPASLSLLQAAFSHYGFAENYEGDRDGAFLRVVKDGVVAGPVLITHTVNDEAVGVAYPLASLLRNQVGAGLGDKNDRFGGLGRNGAQKTPNTHQGELLAVGGAYAFTPGHVHNLLADRFIASHGAIATEQTAYALLSAFAAAS